jgi:hypothetical protein
LHDTHVVTGGKIATSVLMSRNLIQVTVPKDAMATQNTAGNPLIDINVATPNGVSNHLLIPMIAPEPPAKCDPALKLDQPASHANRDASKGPSCEKLTKTALENHPPTANQ